jgi:hypothetical protein
MMRNDKITKNQKTPKPKNPKTQNPKIQKPKSPKTQKPQNPKTKKTPQELGDKGKPLTLGLAKTV